jgi:type I restriction enzyme R subunit
MDERDEILAYIDSLDGVNGKTEQEIRDGYEVFKTQKYANELVDIAGRHGLELESLKTFVEEIVSRKIFDGEKLDDLMEPLDLGWKERANRESALMNDLAPLLKKMVNNQKISGLSAYEE